MIGISFPARPGYEVDFVLKSISPLKIIIKPRSGDVKDGERMESGLLFIAEK
jgi:hypothetical protein